MKEITRKENDFSHKSETANAIFKINKSAFKDSTIATISGVEIDYTKKETYAPLIEKIVNKCRHPFFLVATVNSLNCSGIITDDLKDDYIKDILSFIEKYHSTKDSWKENINLLPEFNENSIRKIIESASTFIPPFIKSDDAKKYFKEKDDLYVKKDIFLRQLYHLGLRATGISYFQTPFGRTYNKLPLIEYGNFSFHTKDYIFVKNEEKLKKDIIKGEITSVSKYDMTAEDGISSLNKAIALLQAYKEGMNAEEVVQKANFVINSYKDLKNEKENLKKDFIK